MKDKYENISEAFSIYITRKLQKIRHNKNFKTMTAKEIIAMQNIDQRMIALKLKGIEDVRQELGAKCIDQSVRGNTLYAVDNIFPRREYFVSYECPSTGRGYMKCVDPDGVEQDIAKKHTRLADLAVSRSHHMTLEQYDNCVES